MFKPDIKAFIIKHEENDLVVVPSIFDTGYSIELMIQALKQKENSDRFYCYEEIVVGSVDNEGDIETVEAEWENMFYALYAYK